MRRLSSLLLVSALSLSTVRGVAGAEQTYERIGPVFEASLGWRHWRQFGVPIDMADLRLTGGVALRRWDRFGFDVTLHGGYGLGRTEAGRSVAAFTTIGTGALWHFEWLRVGANVGTGFIGDVRATTGERDYDPFATASVNVGIEPFEWGGQALFFAGEGHALTWGGAGAVVLELAVGVRFIGPARPARPLPSPATAVR